MQTLYKTIGVLVGRDLIGDALIKLPFLWALRHAFPHAKIHWITSQGGTAYTNLLREPTKGLIDVAEEQPEWLGDKSAQAPHFDLLIDTRNRWRDALDAKKIPHDLFLALAARFVFSDRRPPFWLSKKPHMVDRLLQLVELASKEKAVSTGSLSVREDMLAKAQQILPAGKTYVGFAIGAGNKIKIWPRYKFEELAAKQMDKGRVPVFILGPQEQADYAALAAIMAQAKFPLQERDVWGDEPLGINHTLAVARCLDLAVANDSGVGHMLAAADCPLISLFGPTSAEKLAPRVSSGLVIKAQEFGSNQMKDISWAAVDRAIDYMLMHNPKRKTP